MIKISLTREEIEEAIIAFAKDKILSYGIEQGHNIKVSQGKSANATILLVPKGVSEEEAKAAVSKEDQEIETVAGQPDVPEPTTTVAGFN